jgi:hypothetical protein
MHKLSEVTYNKYREMGSNDINKSKISNDVILETSCLAHIECMDIFGVFVTWNV